MTNPIGQKLETILRWIVSAQGLRRQWFFRLGIARRL